MQSRFQWILLLALLTTMGSLFGQSGTVRDTVLAGEDVILTFVPPDEFSALSNLYCYRRAGEETYIIRVMEPDGNNYRGVIPGEYVTERGVEYFGTFSDGITIISFPDVPDPEDEPAQITVLANEYTSPTVMIEPGVYQMMAIPLILRNPAVAAIFEDDFGEYDDTIWRLFAYRNATNAYVELPDIPEGLANVQPGDAFWLISAENTTFDVDSAFSVNPEDPFTDIVLQPGLNMIGNPFAFPVDWNAVGKSGPLQNPLGFDGAEYTESLILQPWTGYFVSNPGSSPVSLSVPPDEADTTGGSVGKVALSGEEMFLYRISATVPGTPLRDTQNYIGFTTDPAVNLDAVNLNEPPAITRGLRLSIVDDDARFMRNVKRLENGGASWDLQLENAAAPQRVQMNAAADFEAGEEHTLFVLDLDRNAAVPLAHGRFQIDLAANETRRLRMIVGSHEYAEQHSEELSLTPLRFALLANYPNPFNPQTTIPYTVAAPGDVRLEIYNALGQRVRTLVNRNQAAGDYSVEWRGDDQTGNPVTSGVYMIRLQAGQSVSTQKALLVR